MKQAVLFSAMGVLASLGLAVHAEEVGRVISSTPVIQQVAVPRQVCTTQQVVQQSNSGGGALVGAIVGGLLGNTIGHGMGRAAATGVGMVAGAAVGDSVEGRNHPQAMQQCTTQTIYENRSVGYNVQYEYAGKQYNVQLPYDPGQTIRLQLTPVGAGTVTSPETATMPSGPAPAQPVIVAPPIAQTVMPMVAEPAAVVYPAYYSGGPYYRPYYAPIGFSLSLGYSGGHRHHHRGHRHWR